MSVAERKQPKRPASGTTTAQQQPGTSLQEPPGTAGLLQGQAQRTRGGAVQQASARQRSSQDSLSRLPQSRQSSQLEKQAPRQASQAGGSAQEQDAYLVRLLGQGLPPPRPAPEQLAGRPAKRQRGSPPAQPQPQPQPQHRGSRLAHPRAQAAPLKPSQLLRAALGEEQYGEARAAVLRHQEAFLGQLWELHRVVQLQRHLVSACEDAPAMDAELARLEAEQAQRLPGGSGSTVEQAVGPDTGGAAQGAPGPAPPAPGPASMVPPPAAWQGWYGRIHPLAYGQPGGVPMGWGMPGGGGGGGIAPGTFASPFGSMPMDPMMAWYMVHYGQFAQAAMQSAAAAAGAQEASRRAAEAAPAPAPREAPRWWRDPEKVFGLAANPMAVAQPPPPQRQARRPEAQTEATSKPPKPEGRGDLGEERRAPAATASRGAGLTSPSDQPATAEATQKAGSGRSAFKKLPTRSPNARRPPSRAESIGSEVSRSAAERSPVDEGESSGVAHGAPGGRPASDARPQSAGH